MGGTKVHEVMTDRPRCVTAETTVSEAARLMKSEDVGSLPVLDGEKLTGILDGSRHRAARSRRGEGPDRYAGTGSREP